VEESLSGALCPVEHKRGRGAGDVFPSIVHVVAQALCLEEMTGSEVAECALFVITERRRVHLRVADYRDRVVDLICRARTVLLGEAAVTASPGVRLCKNCSVRNACQPEWEWKP
jgi:CRISPR-associated exonuclease Cas4